MQRVATVGLSFWVLKILSTGLGETGADFLDHTFSPILIVLLSGLALAFLLWLQLSAKQFSALRYWSVIVAVSFFGTLAADAVHVALGVPYWVSTSAFSVALVILLIGWSRTAPGLAMTQITSLKSEVFYWAAVMATFALGTAAGDWMAMGLGLGFLVGAGVFALIYVAFMLAGRLHILPATLAFWGAYIFTRPLGASFADWLALPAARGGIGWGTALVTLLWLAAMFTVKLFKR